MSARMRCVGTLGVVFACLAAAGALAERVPDLDPQYAWGEAHAGLRLGLAVEALECGGLPVFTFRTALANVSGLPMFVMAKAVGEDEPAPPTYRLWPGWTMEPPRLKQDRPGTIPQSLGLGMKHDEVRILHQCTLALAVPPGAYEVTAAVPRGPEVLDARGLPLFAVPGQLASLPEMVSGPVDITVAARPPEAPQGQEPEHPGPPTRREVLHVRAFVDGDSDLVLEGNTLRWNHKAFAKPGVAVSGITLPPEGPQVNEYWPTYLNGMAWVPQWKMPGLKEQDVSSPWMLPFPLPGKDAPMAASVHATRARGIVKAAAEDGSVVVSIQDAAGGGDWYEFDVVIEVWDAIPR